MTRDNAPERYSEDELEVGMTVEWHIRGLPLSSGPLGSRDVRGTIVEMGIDDGHADDVILTECPSDPTGEAKIRPKHVARIVERP